MARHLVLPLISEHRVALETCAYCPKLCRAACPVSNADPTEVLTPGGKMTTSWLLARGELSVKAETAAGAWGCTGCLACRERCDHENPVERTLYAARAQWQRAGVAPAASARAVRQHAARRQRNSNRISELAGAHPGTRRIGLLLGCAYLRDPERCREAISVVEKLTGPVRLIDACCGAPLTYAGSPSGAHAEQRSLEIAVSGLDRLVVLDPGCARELNENSIACKTVVELAETGIDRFQRVAGFGDDAPVRWHDPCQLGRGLGLYDAPRRVLERALGRPAEEFDRRREFAACSGAGGLLPLTMPRTAEQIAEERLREHERLGRGTIVTACASSSRHLGGRGAPVLDLVTVMKWSLDG